jgi:hypothetical protein
VTTPPLDPAQPAPGDDWYCDASVDLEQGDILLEFDIVAPRAGSGKSYTFGTRKTRVAILTQTCDIPKNAQRDLLLAEVHSYDFLAQNGPSHFRDRNYKQALARGSAISDFLLPPAPNGEIGWSIVSFRDVFVVPKDTVKAAASADNMLRIASPYKEYLSQAFGRFVMRVGLPATLSEFENYSVT